jgi:hypothetical protein
MEAAKENNFCIGRGIAMGSTGFQLSGLDPDHDCVMLWVESFGITSLVRGVLANVVVFLMALLAQYLGASSANKLQEAKSFTKLRRLERVLSTSGLHLEVDQPPIMSTSSTPTFLTERLKTLLQASNKNKEAADTDTTSMEASRRGNHPGALLNVEFERKVSGWVHLGDSLLHGFRILVAYLLMFAVMTYDIGMILSIVAGFMLGYYLYANETAKVPTSADPCCS